MSNEKHAQKPNWLCGNSQEIILLKNSFKQNNYLEKIPNILHCPEQPQKAVGCLWAAEFSVIVLGGQGAQECKRGTPMHTSSHSATIHCHSWRSVCLLACPHTGGIRLCMHTPCSYRPRIPIKPTPLPWTTALLSDWLTFRNAHKWTSDENGGRSDLCERAFKDEEARWGWGNLPMQKWMRHLL